MSACAQASGAPDVVEESGAGGGTPATEAPSFELRIEDILLPAGFERAPHPVTLADALEPPPGDLTDEELAELALNDPAWRAADGERYEALLVLSDGTSYGRRGPAAVAPVPGPENHYGSVPVDEGEDDELLGNPEDDTQRVILGGYNFTDRRTRVSTTSQLTSFPIRTIGAMSESESASSSTAFCTGTKIGPRAILTASHCVYKNGLWNTSGWFHPGKTNSAHPNIPPVTFSGVYARDYNSPWGRHMDYAVAFLDDVEASADLHWVGVAYWSNASSYAGLHARLIGYPLTDSFCVASPLSSNDCDGWMYRDQHDLTSSSFRSDWQLGYDIDSTDGQSGASVLTLLGTSWVALGVHWGGSLSYGENRAARFRDYMWNDVCEWIASVPSDKATHSICH